MRNSLRLLGVTLECAGIAALVSVVACVMLGVDVEHLARLVRGLLFP